MSLLAGCSDSSPEGKLANLFPDPPALESPTPTPRSAALLSAASVRITDSVIARNAPDTASDRMGTLVADTRVRALEYKSGPGCEEGWIRIDAANWLCARYLEADGRPPAGTELPVVEPGNIVPGEYGQLLTNGAPMYAGPRQISKGVFTRKIYGHTLFSKLEELEIEGRTFWKTASGEYILASDLKPYKPSGFHGLQLEGGVSLPLVFVMPGANPLLPGLKNPEVIDIAAGRGYAPVLERVQIGRARAGMSASYRYRIGPETWVASPLLRYAGIVARPADVGPTERWIDINLDEQVLVAYEGDRPVYATLVSTGRLDPTPRGIFRIYLKQGETTMASEMGDDRPYTVEKVPWTQFFQAGIALHCAYWHNGFGYARSRGCVNLAPIDARLLFNWTDPQPPAGWSSLNGVKQQPGTLVRVHRNIEEPIYYYGYAREVAKARGVPIPATPKLSDQMSSTREEIRLRVEADKARAAQLAARKAVETAGASPVRPEGLSNGPNVGSSEAVSTPPSQAAPVLPPSAPPPPETAPTQLKPSGAFLPRPSLALPATPAPRLATELKFQPPGS